MKFTVIIGKKEDKIFESFKYDKNELDEDEEVEQEERKGDIKPIKDEDIIVLNDNEVISLEMSTEAYQVGQGSSTEGKRLEGAKKRLGIVITIMGKITPVSGTWEKIGVMTKTVLTGGLAWEVFDDALQITRGTKENRGLEESFRFSDVMKAKTLGVAVLTGKGLWNSVNLDKSIENINKIKEWAYDDESHKIVINEKTKEEKKVMLNYRDLLITAEVSDDQTLQYQLTEMYVSSYREKLSNATGVGEYILVLRQKLVNDKGGKKLDGSDFNLVPTISFGDKLTTFLRKFVGLDKDKGKKEDKGAEAGEDTEN